MASKIVFQAIPRVPNFGCQLLVMRHRNRRRRRIASDVHCPESVITTEQSEVLFYVCSFLGGGTPAGDWNFVSAP